MTASDFRVTLLGTGVPIPNPTATGTSVLAAARATIVLSAPSTLARSPVVPVTETV